MDGNPILQGSVPPERRSRRRLSSILKAPRSPLKDLGIGNELFQDTTIEKRRKSSRRVSFAENIRVFAPENKSTDAGDVDNEGNGTASPSSDENQENNGKCHIAGMDTLLHGPIQAPAHQAEWNFSNSNKDLTIFFSSDNDMDMTASNTVAINGPIEERPNKVDTSLFLAGLKAQKDEKSSNFDFKFSTSGQKLTDLQHSTNQSAKIKFGDFLASLGSDKMAGDKENIFPFVTKENTTVDPKMTLPFFAAHENTLNVTRVFRDQDDGLDLTRSHTTNITSFLPTISQANVIFNDHLGAKSKSVNMHESDVRPPKPVSTDQTLLYGEEMDMTCSHTIHIQGDLKETFPFSMGNNDKTCIFIDENEMELTRNNSVFLKGNLKNGLSIRGEEVFRTDQTIICPEEDMDMTRSHTVAIDAMAVDQENMEQTKNNSIFLKGNFKKGLSFIGEEVFHSNKTVICPGEDMDMTRSHTVAIVGNAVDQENEMVLMKNKSVFLKSNVKKGLSVRGEEVFRSDKTIICSEEDMDMTRSHTVAIDGMAVDQENLPQSHAFYKKSDLEQDKSPMNNAKHKRLSVLSTEHAQHPSTEKTFFTFDQDDMEMPKCLTIAIDNKATDKSSNAFVQNPVPKEKHSHFKGLRLSAAFSKTIVFPADSDDMDLTQSHTVCIDQKSLLKNSTQHSIANVPEQTEHLFDDMEMTVVEHKVPKGSMLTATENNKTVVFTTEQQDMDMTRSHTVAINVDTWFKEQSSVYIDDDKKPECVSTDPKYLADRNVDIETKTGVNKGATFTVFKDPKLELQCKPDFPKHGMKAADTSSRKSFGTTYKALQDKTVLFSSDQDDMEVTKSHTVSIDGNMQTLSHNSMPSSLSIDLSKRKSIGLNYSTLPDKTVVFSMDQDDMELTKSHTISIDGKIPSLTSTNVPNILSTDLSKRKSVAPNYRTMPDNAVLFSSDQDDMELTKSHTLSIDHNLCGLTSNNSVPHPIPINVFPSSEKTVLFTCNQDDMEMTKSHTIAIDTKITDLTSRTYAQNPKEKKSNLGGLRLSSGLHKTIVFSAESNEMDLTHSHTVCIDGKSCEQLDMDMTQSHTVAIDSDAWCKGVQVADEQAKDQKYLLDRNAVPKCKMTEVKPSTVHSFDAKPGLGLSVNSVEVPCRKSTGSSYRALPDKTAGVSSDHDNMDMTKSYTISIDGKMQSLPDRNMQKLLFTELSRRNSSVSNYRALPDKTVVFASDQDDMELTKSHTIAIDGKLHSLPSTDRPNMLSTDLSRRKSNASSFSALPDKTVVFSSFQDDMELTTSHTIAIDGKRHSLTSMPNLSTGLSRRKSNAPSYQGLPDNTVVFASDQDEMELTKSHTIAIDGKVHGLSSTDHPTILSTGLSRRKSNAPRYQGLPDKTVVFSSDQDDMELTKSHTIAIDSKLHSSPSTNRPTMLSTDLSRRKSNAPSHQGLPDKTVVFSSDQDEMELTKSHTIDIDDKIHCLPGTDMSSILSACLSNNQALPDKTVVFSSDQDMEMTKSYTISIDGKINNFTGNNMPNMSRELSRRKSVPSCRALPDKTVVFSSDQDDMELTTSNTISIDGKIPRLTSASSKPNLYATYNVPLSSTEKSLHLSCDQDNIEITKSHNTVNRSLVFPSQQDDMELTRSHTVAIDRETISVTDNTQRPNSFQDRRSKGSLQLSSVSNNTIIFSDGNEMELTKSQTTCINQKSLMQNNTSGRRKSILKVPDRTRHLLDDMDITLLGSESQKGTTAKESENNKTLVFTCDQPDMDITRSDTVAIDAFSARPIELPDRSIASDSEKPDFENLGEIQAIKEDTTRPEHMLQVGFLNTAVNRKSGLLQKTFQENTVVFPPNQDDMDFTSSNTVTIKSIFPSREPASDKIGLRIPETTFANKTVMLENDMEYTKCHTTVINRERNPALQNTSIILRTVDCSTNDMGITKSNTIFTDNLETDKEAKCFPYNINTSCMSTVAHNLSVQEDMAMTRAHTLAIENKVFSDERKQNSKLSKSQLCFASDAKKQDMKSLSDKPRASLADCDENDTDITNSVTVFDIPAIKLPPTNFQHTTCKSEDITSTQLLGDAKLGTDHMNVNDGQMTKATQNNTVFFCSQDYMDVTKSHTVTIQNKILGDMTTTRSLASNMHAPEQEESSSVPSKYKSSLSSKRSSSAYNETILQACDMDETTSNVSLKLGNKDKQLSKVDHTMCNQGDLDIVDHTMCNQGDLDIAKCHTTAIESKLASIVPLSINIGAPVQNTTQVPSDLLTDRESAIAASENVETHQRYIRNLYAQKAVENTKDHPSVSILEEGSCSDSDSSKNLNGETFQMNIESSNLLLGIANTFENALEPHVEMQKPRARSNAWSTSLLMNTAISNTGNVEQMETMPALGMSEPEVGSLGIKETDACVQNGMDTTNSNTIFADHEFKGSEHGAVPKSFPYFSNSQSMASDQKLKRTEADNTLNEPFVKVDKIVQHGPEFKNASVMHSSKEPSNCVLDEQEAIDISISGQNAGACTQKDTEDYQIAKKPRLSKRVSFRLPEKDSIVGEPFVELNTDMTLFNRESSYSHVLNEAEDPGESCVQLIGNVFSVPDNVHSKAYNTAANLVGLSDNKSVSLLDASLGGSSLLTNRRRSVADLQMKIKSLTQKSNCRSGNRTAPVSLPDTLSPGYLPEPICEELASEEQGKEYEANEPNDVTKEMCWQNRLSVNVIQPKLPRRSSKRHMQEPESSISKVPSRNSMILLKVLTDKDNGRCIDEEMLPACLDDQEANSPIRYEVPEGAWEELCVEENLHTNLNGSTAEPKETWNGQKRGRDADEDDDKRTEKRARRNDDANSAQTPVAFQTPSDCSKADYSHHTSKSMEQTYCSSSSQDSKADGMSVELSSQQYSQIDSQLPWDSGCGPSLWQKFQDGTITVREFFMLLRIRILIQKPRYSELPANIEAEMAEMSRFTGSADDLLYSKYTVESQEAMSPIDLLLDQFIYQPKLQIYEEECHALYKTIEELKLYTEMQDKALLDVSSLLWEAMSMCSENELMYFGVTLKNLKSVYSKKSKLLAHEGKVSVYIKLLSSAQMQAEELQMRISEANRLLAEMDDCISTLEMETTKLGDTHGNWDRYPDWENDLYEMLDGCNALRDGRFKGSGGELHEGNSLQPKNPLRDYFQKTMATSTSLVRLESLREKLHLEERKEQILTQLGCLQEEARGLDRHLQEPSHTEWDLVEWTDEKATFVFLYDSLDLAIEFGNEIVGEIFNNQPCRRISSITITSQLDDEAAPPSSLLVHRLILQSIEKMGCLHDRYKMQKDLYRLLFDVSLVVSRCKLLGEEVEYLTKWGARYNITKTQVVSNEVHLLFSSSAASAKFELHVQIPDMYPTRPLSFSVLNRIGKIELSSVATVLDKLPVGLWLLKRAVRSIHEKLLV